MGRTMLFLRRLGRRIWFRAALLTLAAVVLALVAGLFGTVFPLQLTIDLGQGSVGSILQILASSMLAVTTFSLTAMVTAYSSATTQATPRATQLLMDDTTSQNVLSTFVGSFAFSLVGIIALSTDYYTDEGRTVLFLGTLVVIAFVVVTLLRWIAHLTTFGRMADVIDRTEKAATHTACEWAAAPTSHGAAATEPQPSQHRVHAERTGYVSFVDMAALDRLADRTGTRLAVEATAGRVADATTPLIRVVSGTLSTDDEAAARRAFHIENHRTYDQDPRLGVIALAEIASRALSPSTNDPGTAIDVIGALQRVFTTILTTPHDDEIRYRHVEVPAVELRDLVEDGFRPVARDGAGMVEVAIRLQKALAALAAADPSRADVFRAMATDALSRADAALAAQDRAALHRVAPEG